MQKLKIEFEDIKKDFFSLKAIMGKEIDAILLFGSYANGKQNARSDIDICVVASRLKKAKQYSDLLRKIWRKINPNKYDVRIFEELPLHIKVSVINNHQIIYSKNPSKFQYYFYYFRKLWQDQSVNWIEK